jgi:predicted dehydrogenase
VTGVAIIGGGRWARVLGSVLAGLDTGPVTVCSLGNPSAWDGRPAGWQLADMSAIWADPGIRHVIIARRARDHAATALTALGAGKALLVEKPFCLTRAQADALLAVGGVCQTGLVFLYAPFLHRFRAAMGKARTLRLVWSDPATETRHGAAKAHDPALNVVQDVLPHAWSIIRPLLDHDPTLIAVQTATGGQSVELALRAGDCDITLLLRRGHGARERVLTVAGTGFDATLDFTTEPGQALLNGAPLDVATGYASPLRAQLSAFLAGTPHPLAPIARAVAALDLTLAAMALIRRDQAAAIRAGDTLALREVALGGIAGDGVPATLADVAQWLGLPADTLAAPWTAALTSDRSAHPPAASG